ncbi:hypothetical protein ACXR6G_11550 [Ancylomarina sp. YFZ004]
MNKDLIGFSIETGDKTLGTPILEKIFDRRILENVTRDEIVEVLRTEMFLDLENIIMRLGGKCDDEDTAISLLQIIEFFAIDYLSLIQRRLRNLGVTKYSLYTLFKAIVGDVEYHDTMSIVEEFSEDARFLFLWGKIEFIIIHFDWLLCIFNLDLEILKTSVSEDELIPYMGGDETSCTDMIIKFENFKNK